MDPDLLNKHFTSTSRCLLGSTPNSPHTLQELINSLSDSSTSSFDHRLVTYCEVLKQLKNVRSDCSTGADQIPAKYLKMSADYIASPLTQIINSFISNNTFPAAWKMARVSPIPKVDSLVNADQYRPIAILPALSKVYEQLVHNQILEFIKQNLIFNESVTGYREGHSTTTVLLRIRDDIIRTMRRSEVTLIAFADFSKAFDTVDCLVVLRKLHAIGFTSNSLNWVPSYLTSQQQFVQIKDKQSILVDVPFGVPQGSILGPLLKSI